MVCDAGQLGDARVAPVGADHEAARASSVSVPARSRATTPRDGAALAAPAAPPPGRASARRPASPPPSRARSGSSISRRRLTARRRAVRAARRSSPSGSRRASCVRTPPAVEDRLEQAEALERRHGRGLDEVRADALEGAAGRAASRPARRARRRGPAAIAVAQPARLAPTIDRVVVRRSRRCCVLVWLFWHLGPLRRVWRIPFVSYYTPRIMKSKPIRLTHDLLRPARPARAARRGDLLRDQAGDGELDRELLARPAHDRLRGARPARGGRLPLGAPGGRRAPPQGLLADRRRAATRWHAWAAEPTAAPPQLRDETDAEGLRRRRPGAAAAGPRTPGTRRSSPSSRATSTMSAARRLAGPSERRCSSAASPTTARCSSCSRKRRRQPRAPRAARAPPGGGRRTCAGRRSPGASAGR